jgi:ubiquinone/menaquinone biosynthesis C-methylase UbiE
MNYVIKIHDIIKYQGIIYLFKIFKNKLLKPRIPNYLDINNLFTNKIGLEIGGPSGIFKDNGYIPIYKIIKNLDGCNFSNKTLWEGNLKSGHTYSYYKQKKGIQYISEATDLSYISSEKYDFIISSNCLEHIANPLKAVAEWVRVIKPMGLLLLVLPNKQYCFDHLRNTTEFNHLLNDYNNLTGENDLTHLEEILELHDLKMDRLAGNYEQFRQRSFKNFENRALHHHVFDISLLKKIYEFNNLEIISTCINEEFIILGKKL